MEVDQNVMAAGELVINNVYKDAAAALLIAELINEANLDETAVIIADMWVVEED